MRVHRSADKDGNAVYGNVYFMEFADSALIVQVTVYYLPSSPTEVVIDDINMRVRNALNAKGIEIPYNYLNVVETKATKNAKKTAPKVIQKTAVKATPKTVKIAVKKGETKALQNQ